MTPEKRAARVLGLWASALILAALFSGCSPAAKFCRRSDLTDSQKLDCIRRDQKLMRILDL